MRPGFANEPRPHAAQAPATRSVEASGDDGIERALGRHYYGKHLGPRNDVRGARGARRTGRPVRNQGGLGASYARRDVCLRADGSAARPARDYRRRRRRRPPARHDRVQNRAAGDRGAGAIEGAQWFGLAPFDRADAQWRTGRHRRDRQRGKCRPACGPHPRGHRPWFARAARNIREADARRRRCDRSLRTMMETIGVIGGGQLGRMFALDAKRMGYSVITLDPVPHSPCGQVSDEQIVAQYDDFDAIDELGRRSDIVTYEFENIAIESVERLENDGYNVTPGSRVLRVTQHRLLEKRFVRSCGIPVAEFEQVDSAADLDRVENMVGYQEGCT